MRRVRFQFLYVMVLMVVLGASCSDVEKTVSTEPEMVTTTTITTTMPPTNTTTTTMTSTTTTTTMASTATTTTRVFPECQLRWAGRCVQPGLIAERVVAKFEGTIYAVLVGEYVKYTLRPGSINGEPIDEVSVTLYLGKHDETEQDVFQDFVVGYAPNNTPTLKYEGCDIPMEPSVLGLDDRLIYYGQVSEDLMGWVVDLEVGRYYAVAVLLGLLEDNFVDFSPEILQILTPPAQELVDYLAGRIDASEHDSVFLQSWLFARPPLCSD